LIHGLCRGRALAAIHYIGPVLTYDLDVFFIPVIGNLDELAPISLDFAVNEG